MHLQIIYTNNGMTDNSWNECQ